MAGEIATGLAALRGAADIITGLIAARDLQKFSGDLIELQNKILAGNNAIATLQDQLLAVKDGKRELEDKLREMENWRAEAERYELKDFGGQTFAYALKLGMENGEPAHYLCAPCMQKREKSILQRLRTTDAGNEVYYCHGCSLKLRLGDKTAPPRAPRSIPPSGSWMG